EYSRYWIVPLVFVLASLLLIPVNVLIIAIATFFPFWQAFAMVMIGVFAATFLDYIVGFFFHENRFFKKFMEGYSEIEEKIDDKGVLPVILLRAFPVLPFSIINFAAGAVRLNLFTFLMGTMMAILPITTLILLFQKSLLKLVNAPTFGGGLLFTTTLLLVIFVGIFVNRRLLSD
ncbi:MAG: VTT domain-containing protein, partial [Ignavibacteriae bacterium]|nr:VTT domain-containing protein [Ignavibacteriota bacterium]